MLLIYGECRQTARQAAELYREQYPDKNPPSQWMFSCPVATLQEIGSFDPRQCSRRSTCTDEAAEVTVLASVAMNPHVSPRQIEHKIGIPKTNVHSILTCHQFHPYRVHLHQELHENDFQNCVQFCQ
ncbi:uncharacterized protein LOC126249075 isoform X2 [Schistocerca nitens]|uniref:uncharacterized protein LOC126249075 isoform X2 n=1 Tax=Schistocerca nitens TaxID=7011 RepID=UPI0021181A2F|nr:uncharacterized protein LOC126249075 isoform X2 [Schistocerca nitens]